MAVCHDCIFTWNLNEIWNKCDGTSTTIIKIILFERINVLINKIRSEFYCLLYFLFIIIMFFVVFRFAITWIIKFIFSINIKYSNAIHAQWSQNISVNKVNIVYRGLYFVAGQSFRKNITSLTRKKNMNKYKNLPHWWQIINIHTFLCDPLICTKLIIFIMKIHRNYVEITKHISAEDYYSLLHMDEQFRHCLWRKK